MPRTVLHNTVYIRNCNRSNLSNIHCCKVLINSVSAAQLYGIAIYIYIYIVTATRSDNNKNKSNAIRICLQHTIIRSDLRAVRSHKMETGSRRTLLANYLYTGSRAQHSRQFTYFQLGFTELAAALFHPLMCFHSLALSGGSPYTARKGCKWRCLRF